MNDSAFNHGMRYRGTLGQKKLTASIKTVAKVQGVLNQYEYFDYAAPFHYSLTFTSLPRLHIRK
jgi:hypothetical protein